MKKHVRSKAVQRKWGSYWKGFAEEGGQLWWMAHHSRGWETPQWAKVSGLGKRKHWQFPRDKHAGEESGVEETNEESSRRIKMRKQGRMHAYGKLMIRVKKKKIAHPLRLKEKHKLDMIYC